MTSSASAHSTQLLAAVGLADPNTMSVNDVVAAAEKLYAQATPPEAQKAAVLLFENAFERGDAARAGYRLGTAYYAGTGTARDIEKAARYFDDAALDKTRFAIFYRGVIRGIPQFSGYDEGASWRLLENALTSGVEAAQPYLDKLRPRFACSGCGALPDPAESSIDGPCKNCMAPAWLRALIGVLKTHQDLAILRLGASGFNGDELEAIKRVWPNCCDVAHAERPLDVLVVGGDVAQGLSSTSGAAEMASQVTTGGRVAFVAPELAGLDNAALATHPLIRTLEASFSVLAVDGVDARAAKRFTVLLCTAFDAASAQKKALAFEQSARTFASINAENERRADCSFSNLYLAHFEKNPHTSYAEFAVTQEAQAVANAGGAHATLGRNVTDSSRNQGFQTFQKYSNILNARASERVLEYGCGSLRVGAGFIRLVAPGSFFAMDVVPDFYEIGKTMVEMDDERRNALTFSTISNAGVDQAAAFGADHVFASAVIFHIHPNDICFAMSNLARLAGKPGAKLIFDAKVTRGSEPQRYAQKDRKGGWAWPLEFYKAALAPLELVQVHDRVVYDWAPEVDFAHLEFRAPFGPKR